jgi:hypothetical protein
VGKLGFLASIHLAHHSGQEFEKSINEFLKRATTSKPDTGPMTKFKQWPSSNNRGNLWESRYGDASYGVGLPLAAELQFTLGVIALHLCNGTESFRIANRNHGAASYGVGLPLAAELQFTLGVIALHLCNGTESFGIANRNHGAASLRCICATA